MQLKQLANQLSISLGNLQNFIFDFGVPLAFTIDKDFKIQTSFLEFTSKHQEFIKKYASDRDQLKTIDDIAKNLALDPQEIKEFFIKNGVPSEKLPEVKTQISSFIIHQYIGGNYDFIYNDLPEVYFFINS